MSTITLDKALDTIMQLPLEQQDMLIEIWYKRRIETRRQEIAKDAQDTIAAFRSGQYKPQPVTRIIAELRSSLTETLSGEDEE
jgi:hypothetical protein